MSKCKVSLVHKGIWEMEKLSLPLACGYIKAYAMDQELLLRIDEAEQEHFHVVGLPERK
jgi:hypothetical protein